MKHHVQARQKHVAQKTVKTVVVQIVMKKIANAVLLATSVMTANNR